ncbi:MAG: helix-turn-helix domain-containing protein [Candidatus Cyclobacteriaceae bacterium M3_2C_046]
MNATDQKPAHHAFIQKLHKIVLQNLDNDQFGVAELSHQVGISRSQLHRKIKLIKNQSVSQFIRQTRLMEALKLLKQEDLTVSEVAYRVGFSSPTYFHKCFQAHFKCAPGDVKNGKIVNCPDASEIIPHLAIQPSYKPPPILNELANKKTLFSLSILIIITIGLLYFSTFVFSDKASVAVLPLHNFTGDAEEDYFVRGFHDGLIGTLGQISNLRVISRKSTLQYEEKHIHLQKIAKELGVEFIIEGSLAGTGDQKFIQLQLIDVFPKESHIWSRKYKQDLSRIMIIEKDITLNILKKLNISLTSLEERLLRNAYTVNPEAYKAYLKGMFYWDKLDKENLDLSEEYFQMALKLDPNYALAYAGISLVWAGRLQMGLSSHKEVFDHLQAATQKAMQLDSTLAEVHYAAGASKCWVEWDYEGAEQIFRKAIAYNPNFSNARAYLSHVLSIMNQPAEAIIEMEKALELDPFNPLIKSLYGMHLNFTGQYDKARSIMVNTLEKDPYNPIALSTLRTTYHLKAMHSEALKIWKLSLREDTVAVKALDRGETSGGYSGALNSLAQLMIERSGRPWQIATLFTRAGIKDEAIKWLEKAYEAHDSNMPYIGIDPIFDFLHHDERFQRLMEKMNLPVPQNTS